MVLRDLLPEMPGLGDVFTAGLKWKLSLVDELWRSITTTERKQSTSNLLLGNVSSIFIFRPNIIYIEINNWVFISLTNTKLSELFLVPYTMSLCLSLVPMEVKGNLAFWLGHCGLAVPQPLCAAQEMCPHFQNKQQGFKGHLYCKWGVVVPYICLPEAWRSSRHQHRFQNELAMWCLFDFSDIITSLPCLPSL